MEEFDLYRNIAERTEGSIYIGVVGPVRTGKSTFIKRFMDLLVIPNIENEYKRDRTKDELPQSANGRTIMTTEPKFVPNEAVEMTLEGNAKFKVRLVDCVGYLIEGAIGHMEDGNPRMVNTPWFDNVIPFEDAAEIGTKKVINDHSTIGLVVTTDGTITDIPRRNYIQAEERVINELKQINKPFVIILNSAKPDSQEAEELRESLEVKYEMPVLLVDCLNMEMRDVDNILSKVLFEFPIRELNYHMPRWIDSLENDHWLKKEIIDGILNSTKDIYRIREVASSTESLSVVDNLESASIRDMDLARGTIDVRLNLKEGLFYRILGEVSGYSIEGDYQLVSLMRDLSNAKKEYDKIKDAIKDVKEVGYGVVAPSVDEIKLEEPEIVKHGGRFGVRLRASAPSLHIIKTNIETEVSPIVGTEKQSEEFIRYFMDEFESNPERIWETNVFGKPLYDMVKEELQSKLYKMPDDIQGKMQLTLEKIVNDTKGSIICIII
ncbi:stage IV sporulation protein A [Lutispora thermophila]|uniref:Stage IV sporulation protein A n=1 Tax=Lutispora thermophila DSM 19022 TaxID=1122184 RepID=A0A1M6CQ77_9FIRM|nr:stage IV sporulation protein A [Lutispora thermophila]SHI63001.1 stage IV sporulation protein A [Lutispora thermophila DSM 19022]